jgi:hypothetical protein
MDIEKELIKNAKRANNSISMAVNEIRRLKEWIRAEGQRNDTCTYDILHKVCEGCKCKRVRKS